MLPPSSFSMRIARSRWCEASHARRDAGATVSRVPARVCLGGPIAAGAERLETGGVSKIATHVANGFAACSTAHAGLHLRRRRKVSNSTSLRCLRAGHEQGE